MDEQMIEQVAERVGRMDLSDHILAWDRKQGGDPPTAEQRICQADKKHGRLQMHAQGNALVCCIARPVPCSYSEPVSR